MTTKWLHFYGIAIVGIFVTGILLFNIGGFWQTSGKVDASGNKIVATGQNTDEIRGWMTLGEVLEAYGGTIEQLEKDLQVENLDPSKQLKDLAEETDEKVSPSILKEYFSEK